MADHIRYDLLTQQALRDVVRSVLADAAKKGLPGDHHFFISFDTQAPGVRLSERLRAQYPQEMTIILQHQFWDLTVSELGFEVGLSFGGTIERLGVPYEAINGFFDPSVQFGLQFEEVTEGQEQNDDRPSPVNALTKGKLKALEAVQDRNQDKNQNKHQDKHQENDQESKQAKPARKTRVPSIPQPGLGSATPAAPPALAAVPDPTPDKPKGGGEVVRLDRFRKK